MVSTVLELKYLLFYFPNLTKFCLLLPFVWYDCKHIGKVKQSLMVVVVVGSAIIPGT